MLCSIWARPIRVGRRRPKRMYPKAAATFGSLAEKFPAGGNIDQGALLSGESLYAQGNKAEAIKAYDRLLKDSANRSAGPTPCTPGAWRRKSRSAADAGGRTTNSCATSRQPARGRSSLEKGGERSFRPATSRLPSGCLAAWPQPRALRGRTSRWAAGDLPGKARAICRCRRVYARLATDFGKSPQAADAMISAGRCYYRAGRTDEARQWLERAMTLHDANSAEAAHGSVGC